MYKTSGIWFNIYGSKSVGVGSESTTDSTDPPEGACQQSQVEHTSQLSAKSADEMHIWRMTGS